MPPKKWTTSDEGALVQLARDGLSRSEIAQRLGRTIGAVETRASQLGIRMTVAAPAVKTNAASSGLRKYFEALPYGKRTGRIAYVIDPISVPRSSAGAEWIEDKAFNAADEILARPGLRALFQTALRKGCAIEIER